MDPRQAAYVPHLSADDTDCCPWGHVFACQDSLLASYEPLVNAVQDDNTLMKKQAHYSPFTHEKPVLSPARFGSSWGRVTKQAEAEKASASFKVMRMVVEPHGLRL